MLQGALNRGPGIWQSGRVDFLGTLAPPAEVRSEFQKWLRRRARQLGLTQDDVARRVQAQVQIHPKTIEAWFQGKSMPSYLPLVALSRALGELPPSLQALCPDERPDET